MFLTMASVKAPAWVEVPIRMVGWTRVDDLGQSDTAGGGLAAQWATYRSRPGFGRAGLLEVLGAGGGWSSVISPWLFQRIRTVW